MQRSILTRTIIVLVVTVACLLFAWPPEKKLRLGKDLAGGVSLTYSVAMEGETDSGAVLREMISVLQNRVDPDGMMAIEIVPQGRDRLEITMPLPTASVVELRKRFDEALTELDKTALTEARIDRIGELPAEQRSKEWEKLAGNNSKRIAQLNTYSAARDTWASLQARYAAETDPQAKQNMVQEVATASLALDQAKAEVLSTVILSEEVRSVVNATNKKFMVKDGNRKVELPSRREMAEKHLRDAHPDSQADIDRLLELHADYLKERKTLDDPNDLMRMLQGAGVLSFRITVKPGELPEEGDLRAQLRERGPGNVESRTVRWFQVNQIESQLNDKREADELFSNPERAGGFFALRGYVGDFYQGEYYMLCFTGPGKELVPSEQDSWRVARANPGVDRLGRPSIEFSMDARGSILLGNLTRDNVGRQMAVLLDDEVYTAPTLNSAISSNGVIEGRFDRQEIDYIVRVLGGGALQAKLSKAPISTNNQAPEQGKENLNAGLRAGVYSLIMCSLFLIGYYFWCGLNATFALGINLVLLLGLMAANYATFSLPGIAGAILCIAMAVDANVLIFERMREESLQGADLKKSVRLGYDKAMSAIVDGNLTNLIHCLVLGFVGTPEIRGFAITMGMGVLTTLFAQLVVTKLIFDAGIEYLGWRKAPMLPLAIPAVQRAFTLSVDWMKYRKVFYAVFGTLVVLSALIIARQGSKMLDTEFVGGTALTLRLKDDANGNPTLLSRAEVQERLIRIADANPRFAELRTADILVLNPDDTTYKSNNFTIKTIIQSETGGSGDVGAAIVHEFADLVDARPALSFTSAEIPDAARAPVFTIVNPRLGANIDRPALTRNVPEFLGGAAIVLNNIQPPTPVAVLKARIDDARSKPEFSSTIGRPMEIAVLDGTDEAVKSAVVLVRDPDHSFFGSSSWNTVVRDREWRLVQTALANEGDLISVQKFDSAVASDFVASAIAAMVLSSLLIVVYVWVRFNSIRYSLAALIPTLIDCFIVTGLVAGAEVLFELAPEFATNLLIFPFKIDLVAVASILTILGYSINDKIVVLDRIRENRGKLTFASREIINESINQTMSRTLMTGTTTILATLILYLVGGEAIRGFAYTLGLGVIIGTASSVALGAPMVWAKTSEVEEPADGSEPATV